MKQQQTQRIKTINEFHRLRGLPKPKHPLICVVNYAEVQRPVDISETNFVFDFYQISIKRGVNVTLKYGQQEYDFDDCVVFFASPNQVFRIEPNPNQTAKRSGWILPIHTDLIRNYPLGKSIKNYGFFTYKVNEAFHLSDEEEKLIENLVRNIEKEFQSRIDSYSQDVIISNLELLLSYCNRFYNRQFVTRKMANNDLLTKFETALSKHFEDNTNIVLPTVHSLAKGLHLSSSYLSDMLRMVTCQNTKQHIHEKLIEKAKELLVTTNLSIGEIAYQLGFEYPHHLIN